MHPDHEVEKLISAARRDAFNEAASVDAKVIAMLMAAGKVSREDVDAALARVAALTTPQPTTPSSTAEQIDAVFRRNLDLLIQNLTVDSDNKITWMVISCRGVEQSLYPLASKRADHYQQLLGVAYVVLGCLVANGLDIPERFLDAFSDPDSVENPLELLPCDFSPARAVRAAVEGAALTDEQRESIREATQCLAYAVTMTQDGYDGETGPASEWDAAAQRLSGELNALLAAPKEES